MKEIKVIATRGQTIAPSMRLGDEAASWCAVFPQAAFSRNTKGKLKIHTARLAEKKPR